MNIRRLSAQMLCLVYACGLFAQTVADFHEGCRAAFCKPAARAAIVRARRRRFPCSPMSRPVRGPRPSKRRCWRGRCRPGSPIRTTASSPTTLAPQNEIDTLAAWVDGGAPRGNPKDTAAAARVCRWMGHPQAGCRDRIAHALLRSRRPASIEYQHILIPAPFKTDKWVQFAEARPTDRSRVHHIIAFIREPGSDWLKDAKPGIPFVPEKPKADDKTDTSATAQRLSGGLRSRPAAGTLRAGTGQADPRRLRHHSAGSLHHQRQSRAQTAAGSASSSPKSRRASAYSLCRRPTGSSKFRPALPIIGWTRSSNWAPT